MRMRHLRIIPSLLAMIVAPSLFAADPPFPPHVALIIPVDGNIMGSAESGLDRQLAFYRHTFRPIARDRRNGPAREIDPADSMVLDVRD